MMVKSKKRQGAVPRWNSRKTFIVVLKNILMLGAFWWLIASGRLNLDILLQPERVGWSWYWFLAVAFVPVSIILLTYRWLTVLKSEGINLTFWSGISTMCQANFFTILLPGVIGGDALKILYLFRNLKEKRTNALVLTLFDRVIGVYGLVLLAIVFMSVYVASDSFSGSGVLGQEAFLLNACYVALPVLLIGTAALLLFGCPFFYTRVFLPLLEKLSALKALSDVSYSLHKVCSWRKLCKLAAISVINHIVNIGIFLCVARALGVEIGILKEMFFNAWGMLGNLLPITPGGAGVAETAFHYLYETGGSVNGSLIALSGRIVNYSIFILLGVPFVFFTGGRLHFQDVKTSVTEAVGFGVRDDNE